MFREPRYEPPSPSPEGPQPLREERLQVSAVLAGLLVDVVGTMLATFVLSFVLSLGLLGEGVPPEQVEERMLELLRSGEVLLAMVVVGATCTFAGGYVAAALAAHQRIRHAVVMGLASLCLAAALDPSSSGQLPDWYRVLSYALIVPAAVLGGALAARQRSPDAGTAPGAGLPPS
jgi:hypothetical protein